LRSYRLWIGRGIIWRCGKGREARAVSSVEWECGEKAEGTEEGREEGERLI
jgi:hypothetical protein